MVDLVTFGVIIDDIVFPDGTTKMGVLGGGGVQTAFGMRLWVPSVGLVAGVGQDYAQMVKAWLKEAKIDQSGLRISEMPTPRAWQLLEYDERRTQVWRVSSEVVHQQLGRSLKFLPEEYRRAKGFHFGMHMDEPDLEFLEALHGLDGVVSVEPFKTADHRPEKTVLRHILSNTDIFSANQLEAFSIVGEKEPLVQLKRFLDSGANVVVIRLGAKGSIVADRKSGKGARIPAVVVNAVDPVGAGNAYCGGFLAGWVQHASMEIAGVYAAVAASFLVEQVGVPMFNEDVRKESRKREDVLMPLVEIFDI
jgi:sugar/nucleoside kinase (ribokinase family)